MRNILLPTLTLALAAAMAAGCVPDRPNQPSPQGSEQFAVLAANTDGYSLDIVLLNHDGIELDVIETDVDSEGWAPSLARHPDGFFLVSDGLNIYRVERDGTSSQFNNEPIWGGILGVSVSEEGDVTTGNAEDGITKLDPEGEIIVHATMGGTCFMDTSPLPGDRGRDASIDIYGPRIVAADSETGALEVLVQGGGGGWQNADRLAVDGRGNFFAGSSWQGHLWRIEDGQPELILDVGNDLGAYQLSAITTAGPDSVLVLIEDSDGSRVIEVDGQGQTTEFAAAEIGLWLDIVRY